MALGGNAASYADMIRISVSSEYFWLLRDSGEARTVPINANP